MKTTYRTHTCGELRSEHDGATIKLTGWVDRRRDYGALVFIDLRDRFGKTQIVFDEEVKELTADAQKLRHEDVVQVEGVVRSRAEENKNPKIATGDIEVHVRALTVLNRSETPPFEVNATAKEGDDVAMELRFKHRTLDLRRPAMQKRLLFRHKLIMALRSHLDRAGFVDVETPILTKATPEGARDYLVPSRVTKGSFYALPQSPQLFKQLLMMAGYDRYYQVARCFRDEDLRADRQPEFTQLDLEMSFVSQDDVFEAIEAMLAEVWTSVLGREVKTPFRRMPYDEAIRRYGIDKPDLRFELEIQDVTAIAAKTEASFLNGPAQHKGGRGERDGAVRALCVEGAAAKFSRKDLDALNDIVKIKGAGGVAWLKVGADGALSGSVKKFFQGDLGAELTAQLSAKEGDLVLMVADKNSDIAAAGAGALRLHVAGKLDLIDTSRDELLWVTDFPYFEYDAADGGYINCRHPFTKPREQDIPLLDTDPLKVHAIAYDLVLNGVELGSGSIRNHEPSLQRKVLEVMGYSAEESERRFGFLIDALRYGAPPHGGAALGLDRFAAELLGLNNLREVVAFPKTAKATCLLTHAPSTVDDDQLEVLAIEVVPQEEAKAKVTV